MNQRSILSAPATRPSSSATRDNHACSVREGLTQRREMGENKLGFFYLLKSGLSDIGMTH
jgi:hypothetical protein